MDLRSLPMPFRLVDVVHCRGEASGPVDDDIMVWSDEEARVAVEVGLVTQELVDSLPLLEDVLRAREKKPE